MSEDRDRQPVSMAWALGVMSSMVGAGAIFWMTSINQNVNSHAADLSRVQSRLSAIESIMPRILIQLDRIEAEVRKPSKENEK